MILLWELDGYLERNLCSVLDSKFETQICTFLRRAIPFLFTERLIEPISTSNTALHFFLNCTYFIGLETRISLRRRLIWLLLLTSKWIFSHHHTQFCSLSVVLALFTYLISFEIWPISFILWFFINHLPLFITIFDHWIRIFSAIFSCFFTSWMQIIDKSTWGFSCSFFISIRYSFLSNVLVMIILRNRFIVGSCRFTPCINTLKCTDSKQNSILFL